MATEVATTAGTAGANGSLASVGTAAKALVLAHPITMAVAGGAILGAGAYYAIGKAFKKKAALAAGQAPAAA